MIDTVKNFASKKLELLKLEATEKSSIGVGTAVFLGFAVVFSLFFIILLNIGLGLWIGSLLGNYGYGMLIMAGFYLVLLIIVILLRKWITNKVANKIIQAIYS